MYHYVAWYASRRTCFGSPARLKEPLQGTLHAAYANERAERTAQVAVLKLWLVSVVFKFRCLVSHIVSDLVSCLVSKVIRYRCFRLCRFLS